ncbi:PepSY domain-containing protein [Peptoniphilus obesi]|uniref:PepSY domain-containing protein n=1 Tax=Peptoniphilus obesi TaxID=1472765 RepID=UPI0004B21EC8|nr:PepSY domain-containing protein [Peptoniphilus obesi]
MNIKKLTGVITMGLLLTACNKADNAATVNNSPEKTENNTKVESNVTNNTSATTNDKAVTSNTGIDYTSDSLYANPNVKLTAKEAADVLLAKYPNAKIKDISFDSDTFEYEVTGIDGTTEYELEINPETGDIIRESQESENEKFFLSDEQILKVEKLLEVAVNHSGNDFKVNEYGISFDDGICELEIELKNADGAEVEYKYDVDTETAI